MGNNNSTLEYSQSRSLKKNNSLHKNHSKSHKNSLFLQNENSLNDFKLHPSIHTSSNSISTINLNPTNEELTYTLFKNKYFINHSNSNSSYSSSIPENNGWDSSTSTLALNNNTLSKLFPGSSSNFNKSNITSPSTFSDENLQTPQMSSPDNYPAIGHITNTFIVDEPDDISFTTLNTSRSSFSMYSRGGHDNNSDETATLNPSSLFYSDEFYSLPERHVLSLLQRDDVEITEIEIWNHLITWGIKNTLQLSTKNFLEWNELDFEALKESLKNCIPWIRFFQIKPQEFAEYVWPFKQVIPKSTIGNFLRLQITGHAPIMESHRTPPRIPSTDVDSTVMTGRHATIIASWIQVEEPIGGITPFNFNLIYRASKDGFSSKTFHEKCDDNGSTILVIKLLDSNKVVGVYNPLSYQNSKRRSIYGNRSKGKSLDTYLSTKEAKKDTFLFSFQTRYYPEDSAIISRIIPEYSDEAITKHPCDGLSFGLGPDLLINLNENDKTGKVFHSTYQNPILNFEGSFEIEDLEVFQVLRKAE